MAMTMARTSSVKRCVLQGSRFAQDGDDLCGGGPFEPAFAQRVIVEAHRTQIGAHEFSRGLGTRLCELFGIEENGDLMPGDRLVIRFHDHRRPAFDCEGGGWICRQGRVHGAVLQGDHMLGKSKFDHLDLGIFDAKGRDDLVEGRHAADANA